MQDPRRQNIRIYVALKLGATMVSVFRPDSKKTSVHVDCNILPQPGPDVPASMAHRYGQWDGGIRIEGWLFGPPFPC
ncbi:uncharacterized protein ARMOST_11536 [Armillaria ostoyae]|uniref:Uncharacterized protein n=1 Tax=Armillaria ostoyae TaxID=47428 RepID=A0A284RHD7_ARMOS|nr:uncharacterized protein ARMOST_11536 [Armillaria ostoyae]